MLKAIIKINKSFDSGINEFSKILEKGDLNIFFNDECIYLDNLSSTLNSKGKLNDSFKITYEIEIIKQKED